MKKTLIFLVTTILAIVFGNISNIYAKDIELVITDDTYVQENFPDVPVWNTRNLFVGNDFIYNKGRTRIYFSFDEDQILNTFENDISRLVSINLNLYQYINSSDTPYEVLVQEIISPFIFTDVVWSNQPLVRETIASFYIDSSPETISINLTDFFKTRILNDERIYGLSLVLSDENMTGGVYWAHECLYVGDPGCVIGQQPSLTIVYDDNHAVIPGVLNESVDVYSRNTGQTLKWDAGIDPDGDKITYTLQMSDTNDFMQILEQFAVDEAQLDLDIVEGLYYVRVVYSDGKLDSYSNIIQIIIDTTPPTIPIWDMLIPFTNQEEVVLSWKQSADNYSTSVLYQICYGTSPDFLDSVCSDPFTDAYFKLDNLDDGTFYYKIKSIDELGNESSWSIGHDLIVDMQSPQIGKLNISTNIYNPRIQSQGIYVSGEIKEDNIQNWELVLSSEFSEDRVLWEGSDLEVNYYFSEDLKDGLYCFYVIAFDKLDQVGRSNYEYFVTDTKEPDFNDWIDRIPEIVSQDKHDLIFNAEVDCDFELLVNSDIICSGVTKSNMNYCGISLTKGLNKISLKIIDKAGNITLVKRVIKLDDDPPRKPVVTLDYKTEMKLGITVQVEQGSTVKFYIGGINIYNATQQELVSSYDVRIDIYKGVKYQLIVKALDKLGNESVFSDPIDIYFPAIYETGTGAGGGNDQKSNVSGYCDYSYNIDTGEEYTDCSIQPPIIEKVFSYKGENEAIDVQVIGDDVVKVTIYARYYKCARRNLFRPSTWSGCNWELYESETMDVKEMFKAVRLYRAGTNSLMDGYVSYLGNDNYYKYMHYLKKDQQPYYKVLKSYIWIGFYTKYSKYQSHYLYSGPSERFIQPLGEDFTNKKIFSFPFANAEDVTQWHGYTAFQSPHKGIDFAVVNLPVYAIADGEVVYAAWDKYGGDCFQGGNGLLIKHENGMYSAYFHLRDYKNASGRLLKVGDKVESNQQIGTSGNTGYYNCKPLKYHLHFEVRTQRSSAYHVDPVPYINIWWAAVYTKDADKFPGRLTGDNPHSTF